MRTILIHIIIFCLTAHSFYGQQFVMHSNYMVNGLPLNPAVAGTKTFAPLVLGFRRQWTGIREAPVAQHLSYHTYVAEQIGIGIHAFNDVAGPARRTGMTGSFSIQVKSSLKTRLSFGMAGTFSQFMIDRNKLVTQEPGDQAVNDRTTNQFIPDLAAGLHWYGHQFHMGISLFNIIQTRTDLFDIMTPVTSTLDRTLYANASYRFGANNDNSLSFEPAAILRLMLNDYQNADGKKRLESALIKLIWESSLSEENLHILCEFAIKRLTIDQRNQLCESLMKSFEDHVEYIENQNEVEVIMDEKIRTFIDFDNKLSVCWAFPRILDDQLKKLVTARSFLDA